MADTLPSLERLEQVAQLLHYGGYRNAEAYPLKDWRALGLPTSQRVYRTVDAFLRAKRAADRYTGVKDWGLEF